MAKTMIVKYNDASKALRTAVKLAYHNDVLFVYEDEAFELTAAIHYIDPKFNKTENLCFCELSYWRECRAKLSDADYDFILTPEEVLDFG